MYSFEKLIVRFSQHLIIAKPEVHALQALLILIFSPYLAVDRIAHTAA